jgi:hypothetical protein
MNESFTLQGTREIRLPERTLIRSWAILNVGRNPILVAIHSNNGPRLQELSISGGEQVIDACCSAHYLMLTCELGTDVELFADHAAKYQWSFKSGGRLLPASMDYEEDFNPLFARPVRPVCISDEEPTDNPASKPLAKRKKGKA